MKGSSYRERDFAFGQLMLTVRTKLGLTQAELADLLGVRRRTVTDWEGGLTYPNVDHLKHFVAFAIERQAFSAEHEAEEVHTLWQAAHQKVLLDEAWLAELQSRAAASQVSTSREESEVTTRSPVSPASSGRRIDWGDAPAVTSFYGRSWELDLLFSWILQERCQVVSVLGQGGIGKSVLATKIMHQIAERFEVVIWRSLRDVPTCEALLDSCLQVLAPQALSDASSSIERRQDLLLECLRNRHVLLVYDNLESFLEEGEDSGRMRAAYKGFSRVLRRIAETEHQSCLLLTSREKSSELVPLEGNRSAVRVLRLARLDEEACQQLLTEKGIAGSLSEQARLIDMYAGNPLALKIVARTIVEIFDGQIAPFLSQGEVVFGGVRALLDEQYARLSAVEQSVLFWLAILREPVNVQGLLAVLGVSVPRGDLLEAIESLRHRSLIELGKLQGSFMLQSVVMEYVTARLIAEVTDEIKQGQCSRLIEHGLELAPCQEYVRQTQQRLLVVPILARLRNSYPKHAALEEQLFALLHEFRSWEDSAQGYGPANLLVLLRELRGHLRGLDLSRLVLRGAYLQEVEMQNTILSGTLLQDCVWTSTFSAIWSVAMSHDGQYQAAGGRRGEIWVREKSTLHLNWQAHSDVVRSLAFSPDGRHLSSGSYDATVKVWDVESGVLLWSSLHTTSISRVAYTPDGTMLASSGTDGIVQLWDAQTGTLLETLPHPHAVFALAWSPDGHLLASSGLDGQVRLWKVQRNSPATCVATLAGHSGWAMGLAFSPNGNLLASANWDHTIKIWDVAQRSLLQTLVGHTDRIQTVVWSPDGRTLASAGFDTMIWLWDMEQHTYRTVLYGHREAVFSLAFLPDSRRLLSGSTDASLRLWDTERGQCEQILQGYAISLYDIAWSPSGIRIASGSSDASVVIWNMENLTQPELLQDHRYLVFGVQWSPDGRWLASSGWDNALRIWDATTGTCVRVMQDPDDPYTSFYGITWSPDGKWLACGNYRQEIQVWEVSTGTRQWVAHDQTGSVRRLAWSPDGARLASASDDGIVSLWNASDGRLLKQLRGHQSKVNDVAWNYDGKRLASGGGSGESGEVFVWDIHSGERVRTLPRHVGIVYAVAWSLDSTMLISGSSDGMIRWWDLQGEQGIQMRQGHQGTIQALKVSPDGSTLASGGDDGAIMLWDLHSGHHLRTLRRDRPYERLTITGIRGLSPAQKETLRALGALETPR